MLKLSDFDYELPSRLIAQAPASPADSARLMTISKATGEIAHRRFFDLPELLQAGDVLVFNDSKVIPARLRGQKATGGKMEIFLLKKVNGRSWQCLIGGKAKPEQPISLTDKIRAVPKHKLDDKTWLVEFNASDRQLFKLGETPLPPYIKQSARAGDYQNVFASKDGSVAAPTAGLHFTKKLLRQLKKKGIQLEFVTLHVGLGTFMPVETENIKQHQMHSEWAQIDQKTANRLNRAKAAGQRIIPVGTTSLRTLESFADAAGKVRSGTTETGIFIYPGYRFKFVDALITNFHLPKSTLLMLVSALAGKKTIKKAYSQAIANDYRFFSFGDGMLIF